MAPRPVLTGPERDARRARVLNAAERLYDGGDGALPAVAAIAAEAGLAKGTVYLHFQTKEEIFLGLLEVRLGALLDTVLAVPAGEDWRRGFAAAYCAALRGHAGFLRLAAMANAVIERNLAAPVGLAFKRRLAERLHAAAAVAAARTGLDPADAARRLLQTYAATLGLWQMLDWPPQLAEALAEPGLAVLHRDFEGELADVLGRLWA